MFRSRSNHFPISSTDEAVMVVIWARWNNRQLGDGVRRVTSFAGVRRLVIGQERYSRVVTTLGQIR
jgi:hypothetical protein